MKCIIKLISSTAMLCCCAPAAAELYVGAAAGVAEARVREGAQSASALAGLGIGSADTRLDKRDPGGRLFLGYRLTRFLSLELGYVDLGKQITESQLRFPGGGSGLLVNNITVDGFDVSLVGETRLKDGLFAYGRVGAFTSEAKAVASAMGAVSLFNADATRREKRDTQAAYALGVRYLLSSDVSLRGEWSRADSVRSFDVLGRPTRTNIDLFSMGVSYHFH